MPEENLTPEQLSAIEEVLKQEKLPKAAQDAVMQAMGLIKKIKSDLPGDSYSAITKILAGLTGYGYEEPEKKKVSKKEEIMNSIPDEVKPELEKIIKSNEDLKKQLEEMQKSAEKKAADDRRKEYLTKAAGFANLPIQTDKLGDLMLLAADKGGDAEKDLVEFLTKADQIVKESATLKEIGTSAPAGAKGWAAIEAKALEKVQKSENKITKEQAVARVLEENPELYDAYMAERS